jgi:hypothetical protein
MLNSGLLSALIPCCFASSRFHNPHNRKTMNKRATLISAVSMLLLCVNAFSQTPAQATVETNHVKTLLQADGTIFENQHEGVFVPIEPTLPQKSLIGHAGLWLAGIDASGNLRTALQVNGKTDFQPGTLSPQTGLSNNDLNKVWQVTCADINQHLADFQDNGVIDNPNPDVFGFPGRRNSFFEQYNPGLTLPGTQQALAGFYEQPGGNGRYQPDKGDYPSIEMRNCAMNKYPEDQRWFVFNDATNHYSGTPAFGMEVQTQAYIFKTPASSLLNNAIFVRYKLLYRGSATLDSCFFGLYADFNIGNPDDDFMGTIPGSQIVYGYNGDALDENGFGSDIPVMAMDLLRGPLGDVIVMDSFEIQPPVDLRSVVIFDNSDILTTPECYNLLSGRQKNGNPVAGSSFMFPDNPNNPSGVSELTAGSTPGKRAAVASYGPFKLYPGAVNEVIVAYYYVYKPGNTVLQNVQSLYDQSEVAQGLFDNCFTGLDNTCDVTLAASDLQDASGLMMYPNPAQSSTLIQQKNGTFLYIEVVDMLGRIVRNVELGQPVQEYRLQTSDLPCGVYAVRVGGKVLELAVMR